MPDRPTPCRVLRPCEPLLDLLESARPYDLASCIWRTGQGIGEGDVDSLEGRWRARRWNAENAARFVRLFTVPRLAEVLEPERFAAMHGHHHVLADALLAEGHWLGEPLALWLARDPSVRGSRRKYEAAAKFLQALPEPEGAFVLPDYDSTVQLSSAQRRGLAKLPGTPDGYALARAVYAVLSHDGATVAPYFTLSIIAQQTWWVTVTQRDDACVFAVGTGRPTRH